MGEQMATKSKYQVELSSEEVSFLQDICRKGLHNARTIVRCRVLLAIHEGLSDQEICTREGVGRTTPFDIRKRYVEEGVERAIYEAARPGKPRCLDDKDCAQALAIACSEPPDGYACWTVSLITEKLRKQTGKKPSRSTVHRILLHNDVKPWQKKNVVCAGT